METLLLKIILCSAVLLLFYKLFLEREKLFTFNRFFLLGSVVLSYVIPFVNLTLPNFKKPQAQLIFEETTQSISLTQTASSELIDWSQIFWIGYILVSLLLLTKSLVSVWKILNLKGEIKTIEGVRIKIIPGLSSPFSFFNTVYLNPKHYAEIEVHATILMHEKIHVIQKHTWDLVFIEVLIILSWINPTLYFYKKAIITNHEFLADDEVVNHEVNIKDYQNLILSEINQASHFSLTNPFNYINTKKRFIMMTTPKSKFAGFKMGLSAIVVTGALIVFSNKVFADTPAPVEPRPKQKMQQSLEETTSKDIISKVNQREKINAGTVQSTNPPKPAPPVPSAPQNVPTDIPTVPAIPPLETVAPEFPGGMHTLRQKVMAEFNTTVLSGNERLLKAEINFNVNTDGTTSDFTVKGNNEVFNTEALRCVKNAAQSAKWKPASVDGNPVKYRFRMPLSMQFEPNPAPKH